MPLFLFTGLMNTLNVPRSDFHTPPPPKLLKLEAKRRVVKRTERVREGMNMHWEIGELSVREREKAGLGCVGERPTGLK